MQNNTIIIVIYNNLKGVIKKDIKNSKHKNAYKEESLV